jgi:hypothetical protein
MHGGLVVRDSVTAEVEEMGVSSSSTDEGVVRTFLELLAIGEDDDLVGVLGR